MPLLFDMPFDELKTYPGTNPRPRDFDAFWDSALAEMQQTDSRVELVAADFECTFAGCFHLYFTGVRGARIHARFVRPLQGSGTQPAVLMFHGYGGASPQWVELLPYAAQGFVVAAMDCRGQAGLSEDVGGHKGTTQAGHIIRGLDGAPENLLFRHIFLDTAQLARIVMEMPDVDASRVGVTGISQGGGLCLACAALEPRIRRAAPIFPFLCDYQRVWQMDMAHDAYAELRTYFRNYDPLHQREAAIFTQLGYIDVQHLAPRICAEVLASIGLMDTTCPPSTQFAAYNKITAPKSFAVYPDFGHEGLPGMNDTIFQFMRSL
ncbi:MAG: acetylxylan esterase [Anaerolineae bacterium]|nr:acetylxylan esterase [Anaerolineae bacterium]NUQ05294.1 alpha/beta fold hydrolase [Anaerolineae bacterium]